MKANTLLLAHLAKSTEGNAQQEDGDTRVQVPGMFLPVLNLPLPIYWVYGGTVTDPMKNSFVYSSQIALGASNTVILFTLGPGLWKLRIQAHIAPAGGVTDLTSSAILRIVLVDGANPTINISRLANSQNAQPQLQIEMDFLVSAEQQIQFLLDTVAGLGTATNVHCVLVTASRFF